MVSKARPQGAGDRLGRENNKDYATGGSHDDFQSCMRERAINHCVRSRGLLNKKVKEAIVRKAKCETRDGRAKRLTQTRR